MYAANSKLKGRDDLVLRFRLRDRRVPGSKPDSPTHRVWGLLHTKSYIVAKRPPSGVIQNVAEGAPASPDRGSKLQGPSQNRTCCFETER
ncbi:hypothetical protein AVEN_182874-1 [Araneus ventricosus]|uniref:Uncharacterized protein n=1 Tax=Araneus ventricosus TaxID=182803 RepID=A0A4Y2JKH5_ARAVE|nr:hypothetical protein AVEN_182874-1 [Araneus ventricosus]